MSGSAGRRKKASIPPNDGVHEPLQSDDNVREALYEQPKKMPDGSLYSIIRYQGRFATKFPLEKYPFDTQFLTVE